MWPRAGRAKPTAQMDDYAGQCDKPRDTASLALRQQAPAPRKLIRNRHMPDHEAVCAPPSAFKRFFSALRALRAALRILRSWFHR